MQWWEAALWGMGGGVTIELVDLYKIVRTAGGTYEMPRGENQFWLAYIIAVAIRLVLGFVSAWALFEAEQLDTALAALGVGAGATGILEHVSRGQRPAVEDSTPDQSSLDT